MIWSRINMKRVHKISRQEWTKINERHGPIITRVQLDRLTDLKHIHVSMRNQIKEVRFCAIGGTVRPEWLPTKLEVFTSISPYTDANDHTCGSQQRYLRGPELPLMPPTLQQFCFGFRMTDESDDEDENGEDTEVENEPTAAASVDLSDEKRDDVEMNSISTTAAVPVTTTTTIFPPPDIQRLIDRKKPSASKNPINADSSPSIGDANIPVRPLPSVARPRKRLRHEPPINNFLPPSTQKKSRSCESATEMIKRVLSQATQLRDVSISVEEGDLIASLPSTVECLSVHMYQGEIGHSWPKSLKHLKIQLDDENAVDLNPVIPPIGLISLSMPIAWRGYRHYDVTMAVVSQMAGLREITFGAGIRSYQQNDGRGDILLIHGNKQLLIDVSITRPTAESNLQRKNINRTPKLAAKLVESRKHNQYDAECAKHSWKLIPFVFESYGALGREGEKFLLDLAEMCEDESPSDFLNHARNMLSVALQSGNSNISMRGQERHHKRKYSNALQIIWDVNKYKCDTSAPGIMDHDRQVTPKDGGASFGYERSFEVLAN